MLYVAKRVALYFPSEPSEATLRGHNAPKQPLGCVVLGNCVAICRIVYFKNKNFFYYAERSEKARSACRK